MSKHLTPDQGDTLNAIEKIREKNNGHWMKNVRIALREAPEETKAVLRQIIVYDGAVTISLKKLVENENSGQTD